MRVDTFIKNLESGNHQFRELITMESAIWTSDSWEEDFKKKTKPKCVVLSFDPPIANPPFAFNWSREDVIYIEKPELNDESYKTVQEALAQVEHAYIVIIEKSRPPHRRKIARWIKNFHETAYRNKSRSEFPEIILAEYKSLLRPLLLTDIQGGHHDSLQA